MGKIANRQSLAFSERNQLSQAIPHFYGERMLHQRTPISLFELQSNESRVYDDQFLCLGGIWLPMNTGDSNRSDNSDSVYLTIARPRPSKNTIFNHNILASSAQVGRGTEQVETAQMNHNHFLDGNDSALVVGFLSRPILEASKTLFLTTKIFPKVLQYNGRRIAIQMGLLCASLTGGYELQNSPNLSSKCSLISSTLLHFKLENHHRMAKQQNQNCRNCFQELTC